MRAVIAIPARSLPAGRVEGWRNDSVGVPVDYVWALHRAGGLEAILAPERIDEREAARRLGRFNGLMLLGGGDVDPTIYGEDPAPECYGVDADADWFEIAMVRAAIERAMPLLAICRGMQVLNVALGGTLDQHISGRQGLKSHGIPGVGPEIHRVRIEAGSSTAKAMDTDAGAVSSSHHQSLKRLGDGLVPVGWSEDGLVEAAEYHGEGWSVAVQWHPERTADRDPAQQGLFDALVEQAVTH